MIFIIKLVCSINCEELLNSSVICYNLIGMNSYVICYNLNMKKMVHYSHCFCG